MLDQLAPLIAPGGATGLLLAVFWMVYTGRLIPRKIHEDRIADKDKQIDLLTRAHDLSSKQVEEMLELSRTTTAVISAIPKARDAL